MATWERIGWIAPSCAKHNMQPSAFAGANTMGKIKKYFYLPCHGTMYAHAAGHKNKTTQNQGLCALSNLHHPRTA